MICEGVNLDGEVATARLSRAAAQVLCEGHFPKQAVVPGAYLLGCMADLADAWVKHRWGRVLVMKRVLRCVFLQPVFPDSDIVVSTRLARAFPEEIAARAEILVSGRTMARALLQYGPSPCP